MERQQNHERRDEGEGEEGEGGGEKERKKGREEGRRRDGPMSVNEGADGLVHQLLPAVWSDVRHRHAQEIDSLCLPSQEVVALAEIEIDTMLSFAPLANLSFFVKILLNFAIFFSKFIKNC